jgi:hypothetical protein
MQLLALLVASQRLECQSFVASRGEIECYSIFHCRARDLLRADSSNVSQRVAATFRAFAAIKDRAKPHAMEAEAGILFRVVPAALGVLVPRIEAVADPAIWAVQANSVARLARRDQLRTGARAPSVGGPAFRSGA